MRTVCSQLRFYVLKPIEDGNRHQIRHYMVCENINDSYSIIVCHLRELANVVFVPLVIKLLGEGDNLSVRPNELDGLML